jgi:hypothetical protein
VLARSIASETIALEERMRRAAEFLAAAAESAARAALTGHAATSG